MRTLFVSLCAGALLVGTAGCSGLTDSTGSSTDPLRGGQSAAHRSDGGNGGTGPGATNGVGMGMGDGIDCKPTDSGRSPCARGDGGDDDGSDNEMENEDADDNGDDGGGKCASLDGGPSPCSKGHENDR